MESSDPVLPISHIDGDACSDSRSMCDELDTAGLTFESDDLYEEEECELDHMVREINEDIWSLDSCSIHSFDSGSSHYDRSNCSDSDCCDDAVDLTPLVLSNRREFTHDTLILTQYSTLQLQQFHTALYRHVVEVKAKYKNLNLTSGNNCDKDIEKDVFESINGSHSVDAVENGYPSHQLHDVVDRRTVLNSCYELYISLQHIVGIHDPEDYILQWSVDESCVSPRLTSPRPCRTLSQHLENGTRTTSDDKRRENLRDVSTILRDGRMCELERERVIMKTTIINIEMSLALE